MNKTDLIHFLDPRKTLTPGKFLVGIIIVVFLANMEAASYLISQGQFVIFGRTYEQEQISTLNILFTFLSNYFPLLVPVRFFTSIVPFILVWKRGGHSKLPIVVKVFLGLILFMFFKSVVALPSFISIQLLGNQHEFLYYSSYQFLPLILVIPSVCLGILTVLFLYFFRSEQDRQVGKEICSRNLRSELSCDDFAFKYGKLLLISLAVAIVIGLVILFLYLSNGNISSVHLTVIQIIGGIFVLVSFIYYLTLIYRRIKTTAISAVLFIVIFMCIYILLILTEVFFTIIHDMNAYITLSFLASIWFQLIVLGGLLAFILPETSRKEEPSELTET